MIDLAIIASISHLRPVAQLGTVDMALTHVVLADADYRSFYRDRARDGVCVLLDNSAYELEESTGRGLASEPVLEAAELIGASVVICQDVLFDGPATVATTRRFLDAAAGVQARLMAVPQGADRAEWLDCYDRLLDMPEVDMVGLSKLSVPRSFGLPVAEARLACVEEILKRPATKPIHLLGGDRSLPWELTEHRRRGNDCVVRSNDSSFAFWYAACGIPVDPATGRADHEAPTKPDLVNGVLPAGRVDDVLANIALLYRAAGIPSVATSPTS